MNARLSAATCVTIAACGGGDRSAGYVATDSAGIRVVTSTAPAWGASSRWSIDTVPVLSIGDASASPAVLFIGVTGARQLDDGRFVVANSGDMALIYFDARGKELLRVGREGAGPGEFRQLTLVATAVDSVLLWDAELDRATLFDGAGKLVRTFRIEARDTSGVSRFGFAPAGRFGDGSLLVAGRLGATTGEQSGLRRDTIPLRRASAEGAVGELIASIPGTEQLIISTKRYLSMADRPFGRRSVTAADGDRVIVGSGDRDEVEVYDTGGTLLAVWRIDRARRAISAIDVAMLGQRQAAQLRQLPPDFADAMRRTLLQVGVPGTLPPYDQLVVDATGATWLRDDVGPVRRDTVAHRWTVLDRDGRWLGSVGTPRRLVVHQITRDRVIGVWSDEDGVEQVRMYRLRR